MESGPTSVRPDVPLEEIAERMRKRRVSSVLVTSPGGRLVGVLYRRDAEQLLGGAAARA